MMSGTAAGPRRPNVLMILVDQMRADHMAHAGNPVVRTPNLDRLADGGVSFSRAYVHSPVCMPSRATLFTGRTPRGHFVRTNGIGLDPGIPTLPARLASIGYRTASFGKIHLRPYERYPQVPAEAVPDEESREAWSEGRRRSLDTPYYGLQEVKLTIGHGTAIEGDYAEELRRQAPGDWTRLQEGARPSPSEAEGCGTYPLPEERHHTAWVADRTLDFLESAAEDGRPFFAMCSFPDPHHPYVPPAPWDRAYAPEEVPAPVGAPEDLEALHPLFRDARAFDTWVAGRRRSTALPDEHLRAIVAHTYGMVSLLDAHVGRLLDALERLDLEDDTIVLFASDHGDLLGDHGLLNKGPFHYEGLLRIPMIWSWPGRIRPRRSDALASLLDVVPTLLELLGVDGIVPPGAGVPAQPPGLPGTSLAPVLEGRADAVQAHVLVENDEDYLGLRLRTIVTREAKLTTYTDRDGPVPHGELFDLSRDPHERNNLWHDPAGRELRHELLTGLHHALTRTDDASLRRVGHA